MNKGFLTIIASILILIVGFAGLFGYQKSLEKKLGATIPQVVALFETTLASKISSSATTMTLTSGTDKAGNALNAYVCFALDEGTASEEFVCGTASSTAVSTLLRGLDPITVATSTALAKEHRRGASVKITDYPQLAIVSRILNGQETLPNIITYASGVTNALIGANGQNMASVGYVVSTSYSGTVDATNAIKGIVELATAGELAAGTATGSTGAYLVAPSSLFNQTSSATNLVPITNSSGKLSSGFIDQTIDYTWSGTNTFSGNVYLATTTSPAVNQSISRYYIDYKLPDSIAGSSTAASNNATTTDDHAVLTKVKEAYVGRAGVYTVTFTLGVDAAPNPVYGQIYKNGTTTGTLRTATSTYTTPQTFSENLTFATGDLLQLYIYKSAGAVNAYNRDLIIYTGNPWPVSF